ncbi:hypothetical protein Pse7367_0955 [Thalassoporum mexicanum PCC 7367]|uniref:DUF4333 domain-containing protein n=1 Tax=Thalassoporum mexicanum TaxID=3457544 RepID=UPI00029FC529|nr:DUF4333 domain-containing protein [Pseudanabaena sp. PCC 7367]AFY69255.1 hypothetical protein Pse7367_0955 [Pseudanabaena sp. PCC 7367]
MKIISFLNQWQIKSRAIAPMLTRIRAKAARSGVILITTAGLAACSFSVGGLPMGELEGLIQDGIEQQVGVKVDAMDCPANRDIEEGDVFACTATTVDGDVLTVTVTQTDDQGNFTWEVANAVPGELPSDSPDRPIATDNNSDDSSADDNNDDPVSDATTPPAQTNNPGNDGNTLNTGRLVEAIATGITQQTGLEVLSVDCPSRPIQAGDTFNCVANGQKDSTMTIAVVQEDDQGNINWEITGSTRILDLSVMEQQLVSQLTEQTGVSGVVDCGGDRYLVAGAGDSFECSGRDNNGNEGVILITVQDDEGNYQWEIN